jgi:hypothetical protein
MNKSILHSITIYMILTMLILLYRPKILNDRNGNLKSLDYFKDLITYGFNYPEEIICLPTLIIFFSILSFIISNQLK